MPIAVCIQLKRFSFFRGLFGQKDGHPVAFRERLILGPDSLSLCPAQVAAVKVREACAAGHQH